MSEMLLMYLILFLVFNLIIYDKPPLVSDFAKIKKRSKIKFATLSLFLKDHL